MVSITTPLVLVVAIAIVTAVGARRRVELGHLIAVVIFSVYLVGVANFVILPLEHDPELARAVGPIPIERLIELTPFFLPGGEPLSREQLLLNVLLTVPFGFGLPFLVRTKVSHVLVVALLFSLGVELAQLVADVLYLALPTWSVDINDVLLNTLGVVVGYSMFRVLGYAYRHTLGSLRLRQGPWAHFHDTLMASTRS